MAVAWPGAPPFMTTDLWEHASLLEFVGTHAGEACRQLQPGRAAGWPQWPLLSATALWLAQLHSPEPVQHAVSGPPDPGFSVETSLTPASRAYAGAPQGKRQAEGQRQAMLGGDMEEVPCIHGGARP